MDQFQELLLAEYTIRDRNQHLDAAVKRRAQQQELPDEPTMRQAVAERLLALAVWLAPEQALPAIQRTAPKHLAHS